MLIEFRIKNFKSIAEEQVFSMVSSAKNPFSFKSMHKVVPNLLPAAGAFGTNASGKSTFIQALRTLDMLFHVSGKMDPESELPVTPFLLSNKTRNQPTQFEIAFIHNKKLYQYGCSLDSKRIYTEWLSMIPEEGRRNEVFSRKYDSKSETYEWDFNDKLVKGPKNSWKQATAHNSLFLSTATKLNADEHVDIFKDVSEWFKRKLDFVEDHFSMPGFNDSYTANLFLDKNDLRYEVESFLKRIGLNFSTIKVTKREEELPKDMPHYIKMGFLIKTEFGHLDNQGQEVFWSLGEESEGTRTLFKIVGYIMRALKNGGVLVIDELHNHLHPFVLDEIIKLFQNKKRNKNDAQLIFTSHIPMPMDRSILSKEQIWIVEMNKNKASQLIPLSSFKALKNEGAPYWKHYLAGRLGGIPNIKEDDA